jgi:pyruvate dehydrogenase phosphatase
MKKMHLYIDEELKKSWSKGDKEVTQAILKGFERVEQEWTQIAQFSFHGGFPKAASVGSCGLVSIVHNNKLYVANAGDSKAVLLRETESGDFERVKVSKTFNANKKYEQERLRKEYPSEKDIVICRSKAACYIKGRLMPSRALGDLHLKMDEFNFHNYS